METVPCGTVGRPYHEDCSMRHSGRIVSSKDTSVSYYITGCSCHRTCNESLTGLNVDLDWTAECVYADDTVLLDISHDRMQIMTEAVEMAKQQLGYFRLENTVS